MTIFKPELMGIVGTILLASCTVSNAQVSNTQVDETERVLVVLTNHAQLGETGEQTGFYLSEAAHPYAVFQEAGYQVDFVSPTGEAAPIDPKSYDMSDPLNRSFVENPSIMAAIEDTLSPTEVDPDDYEAIFFAGGHGTMWDFPDNQSLMQLTASIYEEGGVVAAVCHGPAALVNVQLSNGQYLVEGKTVAAFTNEEEEAVGLTGVMPFLLESMLIERGAEHTEAENFQPHVVVSERLVTGQNPASATGVAEEIVALLR